jgi:hypothetical protein
MYHLVQHSVTVHFTKKQYLCVSYDFQRKHDYFSKQFSLLDMQCAFSKVRTKFFPNLELTQPLIQWILGALSPGGKAEGS